MTRHKNKSNRSGLVKLVVLAFVGLGLLFATLMYGKDIVLFNPKGLIAGEQAHLMMFSVSVLLAVAIPTLSLLYFFAWKYRESNGNAKRYSYKPHGKFFAVSLWILPIIILVVLAHTVLPATHKLDPHKPIANGTKPITIQVIAMRWKWLFIYPEQNIASVNFVQIPTNTPVQFELTADEAPMNSFWIPHLGGQLYAMTEHSNRLNLMATETGDYMGQAAEINGAGFADMKFVAHATSKPDFDKWVQSTQQSPNTLDLGAYNKLLVPSDNNRAAFYSHAESNLYSTVLLKYGDGHHHGATD